MLLILAITMNSFLACASGGSKSERKEFKEMPVAKFDKLRSLPEVADRLGVTVKCLRGWIYYRKIPYVKRLSQH
jgi:hypothetical protein